MKARFDLQITYEENVEWPPVCWRYVLTLMVDGAVARTLLDVRWYFGQVTWWILKHEEALRAELLPAFLIRDFQPYCIADAMGKYQDSPVEDEDSDADFPELEAFGFYRERHLLGFGIPSLRTPDRYIGKFNDRYEVSWFPREGDAEWMEVDIDSLFETTRRAVAALPANSGWTL